MPITVDVKTLPPVTVACLHRVGSVEDIGSALSEALAEAKAHGLADAATKPVRLCKDVGRATEANQRHFDVGVVVDNPATDCGPLQRTQVRGGPYAVALHRGPYSGIGRTYTWLLETWLPNSGYAMHGGPSVEVYLNNPATTAEADLLTEVRLPLRSEA